MPLDVTNVEQILSTCAEALKHYDMDVLLKFVVTQQFIPQFKARRSGAILTTTSLAAIISLPRDGAYEAANQRKYLLDVNAEFSDATEVAQIIFEVATDGKDRIRWTASAKSFTKDIATLWRTKKYLATATCFRRGI